MACGDANHSIEWWQQVVLAYVNDAHCQRNHLWVVLKSQELSAQRLIKWKDSIQNSEYVSPRTIRRNPIQEVAILGGQVWETMGDYTHFVARFYFSEIDANKMSK